MCYKIGDIVEGKVTGIQKYGAFVALDDHTQGLIHISELKHGYVKNVYDILAIHDTVRVMIMDIDEYSKKISLSMRALQPATSHPFAQRKNIKRYGRRSGIGFKSIAERLEDWRKEAMVFFERKRK
ncbi:CvfD/Ygs/GSP13 family RNA-binding post-transcriptional regulator [Allofustis seminis]|uniref:CvfD/Ygs/GSP13 family RNA-binding post-transcriptional regulator n=1 Tax=Allofustis seminis TaxID=166939 RepID=UPI00037013B3|nr:CvfD/Ygs/GSP13 family RNA-binding post-transcriptional regulator [Allofustis seminis]